MLCLMQQDKKDQWFVVKLQVMIQKIESVIHTDEILDKLENRNPGDSGMFGTWLIKIEFYEAIPKKTLKC